MGSGVAVGNGVAVGTGVDVGAAVAVGVGVVPAAAGVSMVMTAGVAVGTAARLGGAVAVAGELGVGVGWMTITRGVGVAVASPAAVGNARGVSVDCIERVAPRVCPSCGVALSAMGAWRAPRPARTTAAMIPVVTRCRRVAEVMVPVTILPSWRPG